MIHMVKLLSILVLIFTVLSILLFKCLCTQLAVKFPQFFEMWYLFKFGWTHINITIILWQAWFFSVFLCKEKPFSQFPISWLRFAINMAKTRVWHSLYICDTEYEKFTQWDCFLSFALCLWRSRLTRVVLWDISSLQDVLKILLFNIHPCILTLLSGLINWDVNETSNTLGQIKEKSGIFHYGPTVATSGAGIRTVWSIAFFLESVKA